MSLGKNLTVVLLFVGLIGCGLGNDEGAEMAIKMVQDFKPSPSSVPVMQMLIAGSSKDEWSVLKTSEGLYRVKFMGSASGKSKELVFGVSLKSRSVMALNREALAYTTPM